VKSTLETGSEEDRPGTGEAERWIAMDGLNKDFAVLGNDHWLLLRA
jgi:hypothetical protein